MSASQGAGRKNEEDRTICSSQICEFTDPRRIIRQIGQFVQHDVRFEVTNRPDKSLPIVTSGQHTEAE
jgi:hypothetical protein